MDTTSTIQVRLASTDGVELVRGWLGSNQGKRWMTLARYVGTALDLKDARGIGEWGVR
ncbi:MAG: hypothetical protein AB1486_24615 [Planctomycetota bacterium]